MYQCASQVAEFIARGVELTIEIQAEAKAATGKGMLKDFKQELKSEESKARLAALAAEVEEFCSGFPCIGFEQADMKYPL